MKLGGNRPPGDNILLFSISGTGSFICPVATCMNLYNKHKGRRGFFDYTTGDARYLVVHRQVTLFTYTIYCIPFDIYIVCVGYMFAVNVEIKLFLPIKCIDDIMI